MKKILILLICLALALGMAACGGSGSGSGSGDSGNSAEPQESGDLFTFATETFEGEAFTSEDVKDAKLVIINLWEPWCGPCVGEMPDLAKIYEEHKDEGLVILGVFSETTMDEDAAEVISEAGVTYPILRHSADFDVFQTGYVPTTVFMTGEGRILSPDPIIGSQSFDTWNTAVISFLEEAEND